MEQCHLKVFHAMQAGEQQVDCAHELTSINLQRVGADLVQAGHPNVQTLGDRISWAIRA